MAHAPPARPACASSNGPASRQKHVFASLRQRNGALAVRATRHRVRTDAKRRCGLCGPRAGLDALVGRPDGHGDAHTADWQRCWSQTRTLAAAEGAVNVQQVALLDKPDLDPNRDQQHARRAATFGTSRARPLDAIAPR